MREPSKAQPDYFLITRLDRLDQIQGLQSIDSNCGIMIDVGLSFEVENACCANGGWIGNAITAFDLRPTEADGADFESTDRRAYSQSSQAS